MNVTIKTEPVKAFIVLFMNGKPSKISRSYAAVIGAQPRIGGMIPLNKPLKPSPLTVPFITSPTPFYSSYIQI